MKLRYAGLGIILLTMVMAAWTVRGTAAQAGAAQKPKTAPAYVIGPTDMLDISVWKEPDISRQVEVRPDGKISLPLLHDVQASGNTPEELGKHITDLLKKYVTDPQVTVTVLKANSQRVYVLGEVNRPGAVELYPKMTVLQALATAGGLTQFANQKHIYVLRKENGNEARFRFNYKRAIRGETTENIVLKPGDTIVVP